MNRPWMPLYVGQYLADTAHLGAADHGAYLLLIMHYWMNDGLPTDDRLLARIAKMTPVQWKKTKPIIEPFFQEGWKHKRIEFELTEAARISAAGRAGGKASGAARRQRHGNDPPTIVERQTNDSGTNDEALHTPTQSKEDSIAANAATPSNSKYVFESGVIRLKQKDFDQWKQSFNHLELGAELLALTPWAGEQTNWFHAVAAALAKRNREIGIRIEQQKSGGKTKEFDWRDALA